MTEFYFFTEWGITLVGILAVAAFVSQIMALIFAWLQRKSDPYRPFRIWHELLLIFFIGLIVFQLAEIRQNYVEAIILELHDDSWYYLFGFQAFVQLPFAFSRRRSTLVVIDNLIILACLPPLQRLWGNAYAYFVIALLLYFWLRALMQVATWARRFSNALTGLSVKQALDRLPIGLLFYDARGSIQIMNQAMRDFAERLVGYVPRNGENFYARLASGDVLAPARVEPFGQDLLVHLGDDVYAVSLDPIRDNNRQYWQVAANDVTYWWEGRQELYERNVHLAERQAELTEQLARLDQIVAERESIRMKKRFHDALGQRVAVMLRALKENTVPDAETLRAFAKGLPEEFYAEDAEVSAEEQYAELVRLYRGISVELLKRGRFPDDEEVAKAFVEIIREATTNAVRHGLADRIYITLETDATEHRLIVRDNGVSVNAPQPEGGGLKGMRAVLYDLGGDLKIETHRGFILTATVPLKREEPDHD